MNANCYKIIFSKHLGTLVAVGEHTSSTGKAASGQGCRGRMVADGFVGVLRFTFASVAMACLSLGNTQAQSSQTTLAANAMPQGGNVSVGSASISTQGAAMAITQTTDKASINWQSFNVGTGASVNIAQPSASSVLLNRVVGNDPSQILGQLKANGQVILLNPNGVAFGKDGSVTASSFTASTFGLTDADFMAGYYKYARNGSTAAVVNQGTIETSAGGFVALIGATVTNEGRIIAPQGDVVLVAAESVTLPTELTKPQAPATPNAVSVRMSKRVRLELDPGAINTAVNNTQSGVIVTEGGQVLLQAAALSTAVASVTHSGRIDTSAPQAGAVTVLADNGVIKVDGSITANSSGTDNQGQARTGGDIIIGRDLETGVLAKATDVSSAKLESLGGFVETSGEYLKTTGISVKAKDWLLDPTDINIVATGTATPDTPSTNSSGTNTYQETSGINTSEVLKSTIESAINGGTNVTITTANQTVGANGAGNITLSTALSFSNTGATDATLTLLAKNGITQNAGASITTNSVTSTKLVNVVMTSEGFYGGAAGASASSAGIRLNSTINTNGDVTLSGTTNNSNAASASNAIGVDSAAAAGITARNISITGSSQSSFGIQSASALTATGNITLEGTSKNWVGVVTTGAINATGALSITGTKTSASGYQGVNVASNLTANSITINGTGVNWDAVQFNTGVTLNATTTLDVAGVSTSAKGVYFLGTNTFNAGRFLINATSTSGYGIHFSGTSTLNTASYDIKATTSAASTNALYFTGGTYTFNSTSTTTDSLIEATRTATGSDSIFVYSGATLNLNSGSGKTSMATSATNVGGGIRLGFAGGSVVNTTGDVTIGSKNSANAYIMQQGTINALSGNLSLKAQAAADAFYMQDGGGTAARVVGTNGANITIDATSTGSGTSVNLNASTNAVNIISTGGVSGSGSAGSISITGVSATGSGIYKNAATITNTNGVITLNGTSSGGAGLGVLTGTGTISASGDLTITGVSTGNNGVYSTGALTSTGASVSVTGTSSTSSALSLQGDITGHQNVSLTGTNTAASNANATVYSNKTVTATNGTIAVTTNTSGTTASALQLASGAALNTTNRAITLSTDSLNLDTTGGAGANINAGTNTVTLQNRSSGVLVNIGGSDVGNATATSRTLGLTNAELNRVTAGSLLIGSNTAGNLTVSSATTLADSRGNISLVTGGNIALSSDLATTGNSQSLTLTAANGSISGAGNITTAAGNTASITVDAATAGTLSGVISGGGSLVKQGASTLTLTGANNYSGTTTISAGTLQVGSGGASGTLGSGAVVNNAALVFSRNATADLTVSGAISGTGTVTQSGTGKTILAADNSYSGTTSVSGGTLQVGNGGATGTLGTANSVALSNNATLAFSKNVNTSITKAVSGDGNVTANITGDLALTSNIALTGTNTINLTASGAITETAGTLAATNLHLTATNGAIGAVGNRIQSNVTNLSFSGGADVYVTEANAVTVSGRTTANNGNIDVATTNGTMTIGSVNSINGITANGTGDITLSGNSNTGNGISINNVVTATNGNVSLTGTTSSTVNYNAGVFSQSTVAAKNITMLATSTSTTGSLLGYYGAGGVFNASQQLSLTGISNSFANGLYSYTGSYLSGTGMTLVGSSIGGQGMGFDRAVTVTNSTSGGINITGTASDSTKQAIGFQGVAITNGGGALAITANNGQIYSGTGDAAWGAAQTNTITNNGTGSVQVTAGNSSATNSDSIDGSVFNITQNTNAGVVVSTSGTGHVTSPKIINAGTGDIVVAAGSALAAGNGTGGQILTVAGNTITNSAGKTYIYTGTVSGTGDLSNLMPPSFDTLHYHGTTYTHNAAFNTDINSTITGGANAQVLFRDSAKPSFTLSLPSASLSKIYGQSDPTIASVRTALQTAYTAGSGAATLTTDVAAAGGGSNTFGVAASEVIAALTGTRAVGENVNVGTPYVYSLSAPSFNTVASGSGVTLVIGKATLTAALTGTATREYNGLTEATLSNANYSLTGWVSTEGASVTQALGAYADPNVVNNTTASKGVVNATLSSANYTANSGTDLNNYNLPTSATGNIGVITAAPLNIKVNNTSAFVTQNANTATDQGFSYTTFKNGESAATALSGSFTRTFTGFDSNNVAISNTPASGTYTGVYGISAIPTAVNGNYAITIQKGNLVVVPADKLLITIGSQSDTYGNRTRTNAGTTGSNTITADYCFNQSIACSGANIASLTMTQLSGNQWKAADNTGSFVVFDTSLINPIYSTGGFLKAGNYVYDASEILPLSLPNGNFTGRATNGGVLTVNSLAMSPNTSNISKTYDGSASLSGMALTPTSALTGDEVSAVASTGVFASANAGTGINFTLGGLSLTGADAANYSLSSNSLSGTGSITAKQLTLAGTTVANKTFDGTTAATVSNNGSLQGLVGVETLNLTNLAAAFDTPTVGTNKPVNVSATLANGTGLASNYTLAASTAYADITAANNNGNGSSGSGSSNFTAIPKPIIPTDNSSEGGGGSGGGSSAGNPYLVLPNNRANSADSCTPNTLEDCLCETQEPRPLEGIAICYQPKKTASTTPAKARRG